MQQNPEHGNAPQKKRGMGCTVSLLLFFVGVFLLTNVFSIRNIEIDGIHFRTEAEVLQQARLKKGGSIFLLNKEEVGKNIDQDPYLQFVDLSVRFPNTVVLEVHEREPFALATWLGVQVLLDDTGRVLDNNGQTLGGWDLPMVSGLDITQLQAGRQMVTRNPAQVEQMLTLFEAIQRNSVASRIEEISVADINDLFLVTLDGMKVSLGDIDLIDQKLQFYLAVESQLTVEQCTKAALDVSAGNTADFRAMPVVNMEYKQDVQRNPYSQIQLNPNATVAPGE